MTADPELLREVRSAARDRDFRFSALAAAKKSVAWDHMFYTQLTDRLRSLMIANPDLPVKWIVRSNGAWKWIECDQRVVSPCEVRIETIAHVPLGAIIKGETGATQMDDRDDSDLEWHRAIVVRMI